MNQEPPSKHGSKSTQLCLATEKKPNASAPIEWNKIGLWYLHSPIWQPSALSKNTRLILICFQPKSIHLNRLLSVGNC